MPGTRAWSALSSIPWYQGNLQGIPRSADSICWDDSSPSRVYEFVAVFDQGIWWKRTGNCSRASVFSAVVTSEYFFRRRLQASIYRALSSTGSPAVVRCSSSSGRISRKRGGRFGAGGSNPYLRAKSTNRRSLPAQVAIAVMSLAISSVGIAAWARRCSYAR
jgi:hypothetical protein